MKRLTLFPNPLTDNELQLENAYQLGVSEGRPIAFIEGAEAAQAQMREAHASMQYAMGIREEMGA